MPNSLRRYLGYGDRGYLAENLPNIAGDLTPVTSRWTGTSVTVKHDGCYTNTVAAATGIGYAGGSSETTGWNIKFSANKSNPKYTSTNEVRPLTLRTNVIIKY